MKYLVAGIGALAVVTMTVPAHAQFHHSAPARVVVVPHGGGNGAGVAWGVAGGVTALGILGALVAPPPPPPVPYVYAAPPPVVYAPPGYYWRRY